MRFLDGQDDAIGQGRDIWVFGYGSLMWRPGFPYLAAERGLLRGYHRALCIYSVIYRGTPDNPGLVMGLDRGGSCAGVTFRVAADEARDVLAYLHDRESGGGDLDVYHRRLLPVRLADGRRVTAYTYVANRDGRRYAGRLPTQRMAELVAGGVGKMGTAREYLHNTLEHLVDFGITDGPLHQVYKAVSAATPAGC